MPWNHPGREVGVANEAAVAMPVTGAPDFRAAAEEQSRAVANGYAPDVGLDGESSLCLKFPGDPTLTLYRIAVVPWVLVTVGLLLFLFGLVLGVLILTPWVDARLVTVGAALGAIVLGLVMAVYFIVSHGVFDRALARRLGPRKRAIEARVAAVYPFAIEDPATYQRQKVISEDYAIGGLDTRREGLLLDGLRYRYVIRPGDVAEVREDKGYLLITYAVRGAAVTLAVTMLLGDNEEEARVLKAVRETLARA
jgi:hypothetical protein